MRPGGHIQAACEVLSNTGPMDQILHYYFKGRRYIGAKDRVAISGLVYGVIRSQAHLDYTLEKGGFPVVNKAPFNQARLRILTYLSKDHSLKEIEELFNGSLYHPAPLSSLERRSLAIEKPSEFPLWVQSECPQWLYPYFEKTFGEETVSYLESLKGQAPFDVRVNTLKGSRDDLLSHHPDATATPYSPWGLRFPHRLATLNNEGVLEAQDEGSQLAAWLTDVKSGDQVLDLCAGAGGKTLAMAAMMNNKGRIVACDIAPWRLNRLKERAKKANACNIEIRTIEDRWFKRQEGRFNCVLVDAPCSGTGTWRRNPDQRWSLSEENLKTLQQTQKELLDTAAILTKKRIVYVTCSLLREENEDVIESFLENNPSFTLRPFADLPTLDHSLRLSPVTHNTDGFFIAVLDKES